VSTSPDDLFDDDAEEVLPAGAGLVPSAAESKPLAKVLPDNKGNRGRPIIRIIAEKGEGLYRCGNCQLFKTPWRRNADKTGAKKCCAEFGVTADTRPCSFSTGDPLNRFNPMTFGDIGISPDMSISDIQLTRILLTRREDELLLAASMPFAIGDKVQFIYQNKYTVGVVESFNKQHVFVKVKHPNDTEQILPLTLGSVTKA